MSDTREEPEEHSDGEDGNVSLHVSDARIYSRGHVTIPGRHRDLHDIEQYDVVDVMLESGDEAPRDIVANDLVVNDDGAVCIPRSKRRLYNIEDDGHYDMYVRLTGLRLPPEE